MSETVYQTDGDQIRCVRHGVVFARTSACEQCALDPGTPPAEVVPPPAKPPKGCLSTEQVERALVAEAQDIRKIRRKLAAMKVKDPSIYNTIAKLAEVWIKLMRAIAERAQRREDEEIVARREKQKRETEGLH